MGSLNQLLPHTIGKVLSEPERLLKIEEYAGRSVGSVSGIITDKSREAVERSLLTTHAIANEIVEKGERWAESASKNWFWKASVGDAQKGLAVVVHEEKIQTIMVLGYERFKKTMGKLNANRTR